VGESPRYDGQDAEQLATLLDLPRVALFERTGSTMDEAHAFGAAGAPSGTLVLAEEQTAGRGRAGHRWRSEPGAGIWLTLLERIVDQAALDVLTIRLGLETAAILDAYADAPVQLKWPNDLLVCGRKLAGILVEARWRDQRPEWVAIGFGLNVRAAPEAGAVALADGAERAEVLAALVPALRGAARSRGALSSAEIAAYAARDAARGRRCTAPAVGVVEGIDACGALLVRAGERTVTCRAGSLVFAEEK
jgi:BirA family biotin operon repressor/biotin-[acetyl-CoA-carboxylase] ligase